MRRPLGLMDFFRSQVCQLALTLWAIGCGADGTRDLINAQFLPGKTDTIPPRLKITSHSDGAIFGSGVYSIQGRASDDVDVLKVIAYIDGQPPVEALGRTAWSFSLDTGPLVTGDYTLFAIATDTAENSAEARLEFSVDKAAPVASLSGLPLSVTDSNDCDIQIGGANIVEYKFNLDDTYYSGAIPIEQPIRYTDYFIDGTHTLRVIGKNTLGTWQTESNATVYSWTVSATPPPLLVAPKTATVSAGSQTEFVISGGKAPYTALVLGSGGALINANTLTYTADAFKDSVAINVSDAFGNLALISIEIQPQDRLPTDISGLVFWLKADALALNDGDTLTDWPDSSGNGRDFTDSLSKPTYLANFVNGEPVVSFAAGDLVGNSYSSGQYLDRPYEAAMNPPTMNFFILLYPADFQALWSVFNNRGGQPFPPVWGFDVFGNQYTDTSGPEPVNGGLLYAAMGNDSGGGWINVSNSKPLVENTWHLAEIRLTDNSLSFYHNGILENLQPFVSFAFLPNNSAPARIGANLAYTTPTVFFPGKIAEIIFYNRGLDLGETQSVRCYLQKKYSLDIGC